jgi:two-component sensor histidine kinase
MTYRLAEATRWLRTHPWLGYAVGLGIFAFGFLLRFAAGGLLDDVPFITLFPAILVAALLGGLHVGLTVAVLSGVGAWFFFVTPQNGWTWTGALTMVLFCVTAAIQLFVIDALNRAVDRLSDERDHVRVLFRELQHRVANNMAFIASLLRLQRRAVEAHPESGAAVLDDADQRLQTMARMHRRLYDPAITDQPLTAYLEGLVKDILDATGARNILCVVEVPPVKLELSRLVTLSLLINELITNAVKHGFQGGEPGTITIRLDRQAQNYVLAVTDNGRGLTGDPHAGIAPTLGMTIIRSLATQLGGDIQWSSDAGTTARMVFPA